MQKKTAEKSLWICRQSKLLLFHIRLLAPNRANRLTVVAVVVVLCVDTAVEEVQTVRVVLAERAERRRPVEALGARGAEAGLVAATGGRKEDMGVVCC